MQNSDFTLTSPIYDATPHRHPLLAITIAWHPDHTRVGEQHVVATPVTGLALSRYLPLFRAPGGEGAGLGYGGISRQPLTIAQHGSGLVLTPPVSRMAIQIDSLEMDGPAHLSAEQIERGVVICLGGAVLLCLHWMHCLPQADSVPGLLGVGGAAIRLRALIRHVAGTGSNVLLLGETGTGKEVAARAIHALSQRAHAPLVTVNMAALNESLAASDLFGASRGAYSGAHTAREGLFTEAQGATLFLDEIGNTPAPVQPMLLRVLETGDYRPLGGQRDLHSTARLIAATDQDLYGGEFNVALLRRLESCVISLPPLRARREDIGVLMVHLLKQADAAAVELPAGLVAGFLCYDWPGNIRQLAHALQRALMSLRLGDMPQFAALVDARPVSSVAQATAGTPPAPGLRRRLSEVGNEQVLKAMQDSGWYIQAAAQLLGVSRPSMYKLLAAHPQIRRVEQIAPEALHAAWTASGGDLAACAAEVQTPVEALRRHVQGLGWLG
ncbi:AAA domain-containing protein [Duganella sp. CY15W]|uniref:sigma 54-interacting transcriptional regulator n=1 Tax=Duganella sp. CY15W TaxID=2692172 RepID=UPI00136F31B6|nr:sigma 54-interacting transcriptional regulator [Duganella sp. CY15W]MYM30898.1 AAA domain-containing protein [Duganella sp. CY15W]